ncbi:MAG: hypothetical protein KOO69_08385, partial [Victivallales bacterium]|nr:hypothetical protein [Victivallales bacterium]
MTYLPEKIKAAKVFMTIKTYPNLSRKYGELVCTAGVCNGKWIRIYPIEFRKKEFQQFKKFQWIGVDLERNWKDFRLESYRPDGDVKLLDHISTKKQGWSERMNELKSLKLYDDFQELISIAKQKPYLSLAMIKPEKIIDFKIEAIARDWTEAQKNYFKQDDFFKEKELLTLRKLPYKYSYVFLTKDNKERKLMVEDWEVGALYWNCFNSSDGDEKEANRKVKDKYMSFATNPNLFFFVGTTLANHQKSRNP